MTRIPTPPFALSHAFAMLDRSELRSTIPSPGKPVTCTPVIRGSVMGSLVGGIVAGTFFVFDNLGRFRMNLYLVLALALGAISGFVDPPTISPALATLAQRSIRAERRAVRSRSVATRRQ